MAPTTTYEETSSPMPTPLRRGRVARSVFTAESGTLHLALEGDLDYETTPELEQTIRLYSSARLRVIIDCERLGFIDTAGIRALSRGWSEGTVVLVHVSEAVARILALLQLDHILDASPTDRRPPSRNGLRVLRTERPAAATRRAAPALTVRM